MTAVMSRFPSERRLCQSVNSVPAGVPHSRSRSKLSELSKSLPPLSINPHEEAIVERLASLNPGRCQRIQFRHAGISEATTSPHIRTTSIIVGSHVLKIITVVLAELGPNKFLWNPSAVSRTSAV